MKKPAKTINNTRDFWIKLCNYNAKLAEEKLQESKKVNHKYLKT